MWGGGGDKETQDRGIIHTGQEVELKQRKEEGEQC